MSATLDVSASLDVSIDSDTIVVQAEQSLIWIDVPSLSAAREHFKPWLHRSKRHASLHRMHAGFTAAGLDVQIRLAGRTIARLGMAAHPGLISRLLGYAPVELRPLSIGLAWWQSGRR